MSSGLRSKQPSRLRKNWQLQKATGLSAYYNLRTFLWLNNKFFQEIFFIFMRVVIPASTVNAPRIWLNHRLDELQILGILPQSLRPTL